MEDWNGKSISGNFFKSRDHFFHFHSSLYLGSAAIEAFPRKNKRDYYKKEQSDDTENTKDKDLNLESNESLETKKLPDTKDDLESNESLLE